MAGSVQFKGRQKVIEAFENSGVECWYIFQHTQAMMKGKGAESFAAYIDMVCGGGDGISNAIYTCRLYDDVKDYKKLKPNTPYDYSFNFRLNLDNMEITGGQYNSLKNYTDLKAEMAEIKALLLETEPVEEEKPNQLGMIGDIIANPAIAPIVPTLLTALVNKIFNTDIQPPTELSAAISGVHDEAALQAAVHKLKKHDPNFTAHLVKLEAIAAKSKPIFDTFIKSLENWNV